MTMAREREEHLSTADIAAAADAQQRQAEPGRAVPPVPRNEADAVHANPGHAVDGDREELAPLFDARLAQEMRGRWSEIQSGFVDDPHQAVRNADELVAQALQDLARSFAQHRQQIDADANAGEGQSSTENLRVALRRYRSFFERLLKV
jgi:hypothetical protein